ncbi:hypothetical protein [Ectothiorhodospira lacustris]|uniref:hypothetical protein n=1 Tax=Ectothiorhodospira lacustris TaxID=2899127 RepID=UPI001EE7B76C|nr:hypothetical protein [Ectothiorhodospira lacustris]MCG5501303.1 hypothetical protein [Ectothiorhodospira lacustris]
MSLAFRFLCWEQTVSESARQMEQPILQLARWPAGRRFATQLSHDIDQIHDRELFRWLGDINHLRRHITSGERAHPRQCIRRILRPAFRPRDPFGQFESIRRIEGKHGWRSTFFLLEDKYWGRLGGRFNWEDPVFRRISEFLLSEGCELGIHGSAYEHVNPAWWDAKVSRFRQLYGCAPLGSRNHYLTLDVPESWRVQATGGLIYDSTFGHPARLGSPGGFCFPFAVPGLKARDGRDFIQQPLSIMDTTLFRYQNLDYQGAMEASLKVLEQVRDTGGLATLLWHNNFFNEEEYIEWEQTYADLLSWLAEEGAWVTTGADIAKWWRARAGVRIERKIDECGKTLWIVTAGEPIDDLVLMAHGLAPGQCLISEAATIASVRDEAPLVTFSHLAPGQQAICRVVQS